MIEPSELWAVAGDCGYPAVLVGRLMVRGETGWRRALYGPRPAVPKERVVLFRGLERALLVSTARGRKRLRAWLDGRRATPEPPCLESDAALRDRLADEVAFFGDIEILPYVVEALAIAPQPIRDMLVPEVALKGHGWSSEGRTVAANSLGPDGRARPTDVWLNGARRDGDSLIHLTLHELFHAWGRPLLGESLAELPEFTSRGHTAVDALAARGGGVWPQALELHSREERLAEAAALCWSLRRSVTPWR